MIPDQLVKDIESAGDLLEKRRMMVHHDEARVPRPDEAEACVQSDRFFQGLLANGVAALNAHAAHCRAFEEYDGVVAGNLGFSAGAEVGEEFLRFAGPVSGAIDGAAVAEQHPVGVAGGLHIFEVPLNMIDRPLCRLSRADVAVAREAAGEDHGRRFGDDHHAFADLAAEQVGRGRLATAGAAGEDDAAAVGARGFIGRACHGKWTIGSSPRLKEEAAPGTCRVPACRGRCRSLVVPGR